MYPPLAKSDWVQGEKERIINVVLKGLSGEIQVNGQSYNQVMPAHNFLSDAQIAATLTYVRQNFGNQADAVSIEEVSKLRNSK
jgi:mono/diheme cytochrome c family protein